MSSEYVTQITPNNMIKLQKKCCHTCIRSSMDEPPITNGTRPRIIIPPQPQQIEAVPMVPHISTNIQNTRKEKNLLPKLSSLASYSDFTSVLEALALMAWALPYRGRP